MSFRSGLVKLPVFVFLFFSVHSSADRASENLDHFSDSTKTDPSVQQINRFQSRPLKVDCPDESKKFDPHLVDYRGMRTRLGEPTEKRPTLVIVAPPDSKDRVLEFLAEFAKPIWESKKTGRILESTRKNSGSLLYEAWNESPSKAWQSFKNKMGKLDDLRVVLFADARPLYQDRLKEGLQQAQIEREKAISAGRREGARKGAQIGASKGREYGFPLFKNWIGLFEDIGRKKGREEGSRRGAQLAAEVADTFIPPYVTYLAEKELLQKSDELLPSVRQILEDRLVKDFESQCSLSILVDKKDFENGISESNWQRVQWANEYMPEDKRINIS